jgi:hypothetical protein
LTDPQITSDRAKLAINARLKGMTKAQRDDMTRAARAAQLRKIEDEVDPNRTLNPKERERRTKYALNGRMAKVRLARRRDQERIAAQNEALDTLAKVEAEAASREASE